VDSTLTTDNVQSIIDDFKYTKGLSDTGSGPYLMLVPNNQFVKFKAQAKASHTIIEQMPEGLVKMAKMGVTSDVVRVDDFYIVRDPWLTTNGYTTTVIMPRREHAQDHVPPEAQLLGRQVQRPDRLRRQPVGHRSRVHPNAVHARTTTRTQRDESRVV
jgi:hypothetical protein